MKTILLLISVFTGTIGFGQNERYASFLIPEELKENANAVIRERNLELKVLAQDEVLFFEQTVITILNEYGMANLDLSESHSPKRKIQQFDVRILNALGTEIRNFKKKDFRDMSAADGFSVFNDTRLLSLDYTAVSYPFTAVITKEIRGSNTAFLPAWSPLSGYLVSSEKESVVVSFEPALGFGYKEVNFDSRFAIEKIESANEIRFSAKNIKALKGEESSPEFIKIAPVVYFKVEKFNLEGTNGQAANWKDFGKWYYDNLLVGTDALPMETQNKIKGIVGAEKDPVAIARLVYQYVQDRTRYVSIQVGIGGFKPMLAADVDRLGYGDCKALVNYTRALLAVCGVTSYYTIVHSGRGSRVGLQSDFASVQGNHIILALPVNGENIWLECTSQLSPFGFQGTFTDGREVLVVKPDGGEIVKTPALNGSLNQQSTKGSYGIMSDGSLEGALEIESKGSQYDSAYLRERFSLRDQESYYKEYFDNIGSLKLGKISFQNDKKLVSFKQSIALSGLNYASQANDRLIFPVNAFNAQSYSPKRYRNRENPFQVTRGYLDEDQIEIDLPEGYAVESLPADLVLKTKYGEYELKVTKVSEKKLSYKRVLLLNDGLYPKEEYDAYRQFREQISRNDKAKIVLLKS